MRPFRPGLAVDFHGVVHSHASPHPGTGIADDPPVPGAIEFLDAAAERFDVSIVSARFSQDGVGHVEAKKAVLAWLKRNGLKARVTAEPDRAGPIVLCRTRPKTQVLLDDRAIRFEGAFPDLDALEAFRPWNRPAPLPAGHSPPRTPASPALRTIPAEDERGNTGADL